MPRSDAIINGLPWTAFPGTLLESLLPNMTSVVWANVTPAFVYVGRKS